MRKHGLVTVRRRRLHKRKRQMSWLRWLCKPSVLKAAFQIVRLIIELIRAIWWW